MCSEWSARFVVLLVVIAGAPGCIDDARCRSKDHLYAYNVDPLPWTIQASEAFLEVSASHQFSEVVVAAEFPLFARGDGSGWDLCPDEDFCDPHVFIGRDPRADACNQTEPLRYSLTFRLAEHPPIETSLEEGEGIRTIGLWDGGEVRCELALPPHKQG